MITSVLTIAVALATADAPAREVPILVAAASDLQAAFSEVGRAFEADGNGKVSFTFGASGLLTKQVKEGAPFDVLAAANVAFVDDAVTSGACDGATKSGYARGHIVVWSKKGASLAAPKDLADLADVRFKHIAIANPETAPYGIAAKQALTAAGVWDKVSARIVLGENVRQTLQLAETGNADVAIVALSLAIPSTTGTWIVVDEKLHAPLEQALAVCTRGERRSGGEAFVRYVTSPKGRVILERYGFAAPAKRP